MRSELLIEDTVIDMSLIDCKKNWFRAWLVLRPRDANAQFDQGASWQTVITWRSKQQKKHDIFPERPGSSQHCRIHRTCQNCHSRSYKIPVWLCIPATARCVTFW